MNNNNPLVTQQADANPYRYAASEVLNRLKWDLNPESWRSRKKLQTLRDRYVGEKAVIVCNGPSLLKSDLSILKNVFTFGLNKIYLLFEQSDFRPSCIVAMNPYVIDQAKDFYNSTDIPLFLNSAALKIIRPRDNISFLHETMQSKFAKDCSLSLNIGFTVTFVAMQLAFHMGFDEVALIGCDHNFASKGLANNLVIAGDRDDNHFHPKYFADGVKWQLPDLVKSEMFYCLARDVYESHGRKIINCTEGGHLEVFERYAIESWLLGK
jgi:hypothetical protein